MTPLEAFGLPADADERAVKREYARRLKQTRPDDDADAFQALQAAYASALEWLRNPVQFDDFTYDEDEEGQDDASVVETAVDFDREAILANFHASLHGVRPPREDDAEADALFARIVEHGCRNDVAALRTMLANDPALYSLDRKAELRDALLVRLEVDTPPMSGAAFDVLADFFQMGSVANHYETWRQLRLRQRLQVAHDLQGEKIPAGDRWKRHILLRARSAWQRHLFALIPFVPTHVRGYLHSLDDGRIEDLPPPIEPAAAAFWDKAGDLGRFSLVKLGIGLSRLVAYVLIAYLVGRLAGNDGTLLALGIGFLYALAGGVSAVVSWAGERWRGHLQRGGFNWWLILWLGFIVIKAIVFFTH